MFADKNVKRLSEQEPELLGNWRRANVFGQQAASQPPTRVAYVQPAMD
jgi:hypothetical protein